MAAPSGQAASICSPLYSTWQGRQGAPCEKLHDKLRDEGTVWRAALPNHLLHDGQRCVFRDLKPSSQ